MKFSLRLLLGYFLIVALAGYFVLNIFLQEVKPGVRRATEETLVDTAHLLAQFAAQEWRQHPSNQDTFTEIFARLNREKIGAKIDGIRKNHFSYRIYITNIHGRVIFDSTGEAVGQDYSRWNDVYLTLKGQYGARSTRSIPDDDRSSVMYVAAPVKLEGQLVGVLTVAKPNSSMNPVIKQGERRILLAGGTLLGIALLIGIVVVWWINRSISRLMRYASEVSEGKNVLLPKMDSPELDRLAGALEAMRLKLEGKAYVEQYIHTLTHELKSPLAATRGAAELLLESPPPEVAKRFIHNIQQQNQRMQRLIDRMLLLAKVESRSGLEMKPLDFCAVVREVINGKEAQARALGIELRLSLDTPCRLLGDELLLSQAFCNLLDNALDFSSTGGVITVTGQNVSGSYHLLVEDQGTGIPDFAMPAIFDRFYSLPRPQGDRSSGLGLSFVQEVALIHQGEITLRNHASGIGTVACLKLPLF